MSNTTKKLLLKRNTSIQDNREKAIKLVAKQLQNGVNNDGELISIKYGESSQKLNTILAYKNKDNDFAIFEGVKVSFNDTGNMDNGAISIDNPNIPLESIKSKLNGVSIYDLGLTNLPIEPQEHDDIVSNKKITVKVKDANTNNIKDVDVPTLEKITDLINANNKGVPSVIQEKLNEKLNTSDFLTKLKEKISDNGNVRMFNDGDKIKFDVTIDKTLFVTVNGDDITTAKARPDSGKEDKIHILIPTSSSEVNKDKFKEYLWVNNRWELVGESSSRFDISSVFTNNEFTKLFDGGFNNQSDKIAKKSDVTAISDNLNEHTPKVASSTELGHIKVDKNGLKVETEILKINLKPSDTLMEITSEGVLKTKDDFVIDCGEY